jgi:hypothetical protein
MHQMKKHDFSLPHFQVRQGQKTILKQTTSPFQKASSATAQTILKTKPQQRLT